jgi:DNA modification methylase
MLRVRNLKHVPDPLPCERNQVAAAVSTPGPMDGNYLYRGDCLAILPTLPEASVQLVLTSPPYNTGWDYADGGAGDRRPLPQYLELLATALAGCYRVLRPGGVLALNLPPSINVRDQYRAYPLAAWATMHLLEQGWLLREPITWVKTARSNPEEPYTFQRVLGAPANFRLRPCKEEILLASKATYRVSNKRVWPADERYIEICKDVWPLPAGRAKRGEPLAFPRDLVARLVKLFSEPQDLVLDPFAGTGSVGRVAHQLGRRAWVIEREPRYWPRLEALVSELRLPNERATVGPSGLEVSA